MNRNLLMVIIVFTEFSLENCFKVICFHFKRASKQHKHRQKRIRKSKSQINVCK